MAGVMKSGNASSTSNSIRGKSGEVGPHNFKEHFDADIVEYVREDVRLSTLQRKLVRENNTLVSHALACQISEVIYYHENRPYVFRSFEVISDAAFEVIHSSKHGDKVKSETANAIGRVGCILAMYNDGDFDCFWKYYKNIWQRFGDGSKKEKDLVYYVKIFNVILFSKSSPTASVMEALAEDLQRTLEETENPLLVPPLINCLVKISELNPRLFEPRFKDIVDILVGWHVDPGQSPTLKMQISSVLLSWHSYWIVDLEFSAGLLSQFVEDIEAFNEEVEECSTSGTNLTVCLEKIASVIQVFNTVLSCLRSKSKQNAVSFLPGESLKWTEIILSCLLSTLNKAHDEDILLAGHQSIMMLSERMENLFKDNAKQMIEFYTVSMKSFKKLSYKGQAFALEFAERMISHVEHQKQQQVEFGKTKMAPEIFVKMVLDIDLVGLGASTNGKETRKASVRFFRNLLKSKNILVLQEGYAALLKAFQTALINLPVNAKHVLFVLECLSDVINAKGSILSIWALDPPVFLLLAKQGRLLDAEFCKYEPLTHYAILRMLKTHCSCHHQFLASSQLLTTNQTTLTSMAPTAKYFQILLKTITEIIKLDLNEGAKGLMMDWIQDVLKSTSKSFQELIQTPEFYTFIEFLLDTQNFNLYFLNCLFDHLPVIQFQDHVYDRLLQQIDSDDAKERNYSYEIIRKLSPLGLDWIKGNRDQPMKSASSSEHQNRREMTLRTSEFKSFSEVMIPNSFDLNSQDQDLRNLLALHGEEFKYRQSKLIWVGDQIANYCVNNKLKTTFGKAQETLGAYEKTMRSLARSLGNKKMDSLSSCTEQVVLGRNFLIIFERLEKAMFNAWDGNNLQAFFVANKKTCLDWLSRVQVMATHVAFNLGEFAFAIRHGQLALKKLTNNEGQGQDDLMAIVAISMKNLDNGPETISGLYAYGAQQMNKKFRWMKGLICLAQKKYEEGSRLIQDHLNGTNGLCKELLIKEIITVQFNLCDYKNYVKYHQQYKEDQSTSTPNETASTQINQNGIHQGYEKSLQALCSFEQGSLNKALVNDYMDTDLRNSENTIMYVQYGLLQSTQRYVAQNDDQMVFLDKILSILLQNHALTNNQLKKALILSSIKQRFDELMDERRNRNDLETFLTYKERHHDSSNLLWIKKWGEYFMRFSQQKNFHLHFKLNSLNLEIAIQARKEHNFNLAKRHLEQNLGCFTDLGQGGATRGGGGKESGLISHISDINFNNPSLVLSTDKANCLRHSAKLVYVLPPSESASHHNKMVAVQVLCGIAYKGLQSTESPDLWNISAKSFNTLSKWLKKNPQLMDPDVVSSTQDTVSLTQILAHQPVSNEVMDPHSLLLTDAATDSDMVIGRLLRLSVTLAPIMAKAWYEFANWSLEMGEKVLASAINGRIPLNQTELSNLADTTEHQLNEENMQVILDLFGQVHLKQVQAEIEVDKTEFMRKTLVQLPFLKGLNVDSILQVWQLVQKRIFYYQELATGSYFKFISLNDGLKEQRVISATLRLLQLIVKHSFELQDSLQEGLDQTPSQCWKGIIPQLFSRLNHPVKVVRNRISDLLCRIASDFPNLVIFPAVVGSVASETVKVSKMVGSNEEENQLGDDEDGLDDDQTPEMQSAHEKIVHVMASTIPESVDHVKILVSELQRTSILWDELWFGTIQQYQHEVMKKIKKMEEEIEKLQRNSSLSDDEKKELVKEKYYILFKPLLYVLNRVESITKDPQTPAEHWFDKRYGKYISDMMVKLKDPDDHNNPKKYWAMLTTLQSNIASKLLKKGVLRLSEISPALAQLKSTLIPLPGQDDEKNLTLYSFDEMLQILPTKTKPKKLKVKASDGKSYTYLFKGLEDLHLDERIMQFLSIANTLMKTKDQSFFARHYSVVPLGPRSGLIQWVEGAIPMFSLYKKWHQRRQIKLELTKKGDSSRNIPQKPADQYYNKLIPLLRDHGINNLDNRKEWPLSVMRQVLMELMDETPNDLLSSHLWLSSKNSNDWHKLKTNLTRSVAVMSVIGYIIGLGDRHLDNLLIDFNRGEIIHIDYNVCFEKGTKLRIPEKVPCRLTQNMVHLFGLTGVEGVFRLSCEKALECLRSGKETLLTLLEAFIYDPLVDWTPGFSIFASHRNAPEADGNQLVQDKKDMQAEITFSMLNVRVAEMKRSWLENKATLSNDLMTLEDNLSSILDQMSSLQGFKESLTKLHKSMAILKEAESNSSHKLYALQDRYAEHRAVEVAVEAAKIKINSFIEDYEKMASLVQRVSTSISSGQLAKWTSELTTLSTVTSSTSSQVVASFLRSAGQTQLLDQLESVETGFRINLDKMRASLNLGLQLFGHCTTMTSMYPKSHKEEHRVQLYLKWLKKINDNFDSDSCQEVVNEFNAKFVDVNSEPKRMKKHQVMNLNFQLENGSQDIHFKLQTIFQRMINQGIENSNAVVEAGKMIIREATDYVDKETSLTITLCLKQLQASQDKIKELESTIDPSTFNVQLGQQDLLIDELFVEIGFCDQILQLMEKFQLFHEKNSVNRFHAFINAIKHFKHLKGSYFAIILQEGLKNCQKEDSSLEKAHDLIDNMMNQETIDDFYNLIHDIEKAGNLDQIAKGESIDDNFKEIMKKLNTNSGILNSGEMIIMALNALLDNIDAAFMGGGGNLQQQQQQTPENHRLRLASKLSRLICMKNFFELCKKSMSCFKSDQAGQLFPSGEDLGYPISRYMANYYIRHFKGQICGQVINDVVADLLADQISDMNLNTSNSIQDQIDRISKQRGADKVHFLTLELNAIFANLRKTELSLHLEHKVEILNACQQINQLQRNSFQWFHEDHLALDAITLVPPFRMQVLNDLKNCLTALINGQQELNEVYARYTELTNTVEQRLRWACGANPDLQEIFDQFSSAFASEIENMKAVMTLSKTMSASANTMMHYELLRTTTREAMSSDSFVMSLFSECQQSVQLQEVQNQSQELGTVELNIFSTNPPEDLIDQKWIKKTADIVAKKMRGVQNESNEDQEKMKANFQHLQSKILEFKKTLTSHQKLMADVGALLRSIDKAEDLDVPEIKTYLNNYRDFTDRVSSMLKMINEGDHGAEGNLREVLAAIESLKESLPDIYDHLISLTTLLKDENIDQFKKPGGQVKDNAEVTAVNAEEKNTFALSVLRRIKMKLDGREPDVLRKATVAEQVDFIIREATNVDNLALLYEGWTAWI